LSAITKQCYLLYFVNILPLEKLKGPGRKSQHPVEEGEQEGEVPHRGGPGVHWDSGDSGGSGPLPDPDSGMSVYNIIGQEQNGKYWGHRMIYPQYSSQYISSRFESFGTDASGESRSGRYYW
jgi:hypothetical protein